MYLAGIIVFLLMAGMLYVRLAPTDVARWHQPIEAAQSADLADGAVRVIAADEQSFERVAQAATSLPRTEVVAGSVAEGRITFRTRSKWIGFPDFTTIEYDNGTLKMYARLRFGQSDMGVNAARLEQLLGAAQSG
ncbi:DUF1499 domain-containing protein [Tateyamaria pelophila]|uniref:DUF1499 domain-containing protein n=1 Tax=Tateyamaria pelophila TaxID=328415 RepID=UPI001CBC4ED0|nr:DUF1499 domain-containing protein [Tateyamaria pelophila]